MIYLIGILFILHEDLANFIYPIVFLRNNSFGRSFSKYNSLGRRKKQNKFKSNDWRFYAYPKWVASWYLVILWKHKSCTRSIYTFILYWFSVLNMSVFYKAQPEVQRLNYTFSFFKIHRIIWVLRYRWNWFYYLEVMILKITFYKATTVSIQLLHKMEFLVNSQS